MSSQYNCDYITSLPLLKERAYEVSKGQWNNYSEDIGETLLKFLATTSHTIDYYYRKYLENLLLPCDNWNSKNLTWELTGYKPPYIRADYLMVQLYWPNCGLLSYVPIYMYTPFTVVADGDSYTFMAAEDYLIPPKTSRVNIKLVQGTLKTIELEIDKITDASVKLSDEPIDYDLVQVVISGERWKQVRNVFYEYDTSKIFSLHREEDGVYLRFHSSWKSYVDNLNKTGTIHFVLSDQAFDDYTDDCLAITFAGPLIDTYGMDVSSFYRIHPMLNADTGIDILPSTMEGDRVITTQDYADKAKLYPGVSSCKGYSWNTPSVTRDPLTVTLVATGPRGPLRGRTKEAVIKFLEEAGSPNISVKIMDPVYTSYSLRLAVDIGVYKGTLAEIQLKLLARTVVEDFFDSSNMEIGQDVDLRELEAAVQRADQRFLFVEAYKLNTVFVTPYSIPTLGSVVVYADVANVPLNDTGIVREAVKRANAVYKDDFGTAVDYLAEFSGGYPLKTKLVGKDSVSIDKDVVAYDRSETSYAFDIKSDGVPQAPPIGESAVATEASNIQKLNQELPV